ncbi:MAG TPA: IclR family transcriptional regulator [Amycolatopsis sp.]|nr:IclR family transcriptional regulator [Amycolatopsis sp.]
MQLVVRTLRVLRALAVHSRGMSLQELHERLDIPVASVHRVMATLIEQEFVTRSPVNRRYFLGPAARKLGQPDSQQGALLARPHPAVVEAAQTTGETVFLAELIGDRAVCVGLIEGHSPLRLFVRIGQDLPLHAAAASRALLAYLGEDIARALLAGRNLPAFTPATPVSVEAVLRHLALVRTRGHDICDDELDRGVWAVSAPIFCSTGEPVASVTMAAAGQRMTDPGTRAAATRTMQNAAGEMSAELGYSPGRRERVSVVALRPAAAPARTRG